MIVLACPVVDNQEFTQVVFKSLVETVQDTENFVFVIIDNNSDTPYKEKDYKSPFKTVIIRNKENLGYYYPLKQVQELYPEAEYLGLVHNDLTFYEVGWDKRIVTEFNYDPQLGCIGFCGSWAVDRNGGRSYGTVCNFRGVNGQPQQGTGTKINDRKPSVSLDSLFMMFRREAIDCLGIDENIVLCHFYDRIWTLKEWIAGWHVIVLGIEVDHQGGRTSCSPRYMEDARKWCEARNIPIMNDNPDLTMYKQGEERYLKEFAYYIPSIVDDNYNVRPHS